ncbi:MAG: hypothetical protein Q9157_004629 [Trypethelium eluteriae]
MVEDLDDATWQKLIHEEVSDLPAKIRIDALLKEASARRDGVKCNFEPGKYLGAGAIMGCANYHGWIRFNDGKSWIVRVPRVGYGEVPNDLIDYLVASEYATLKFLEDTKVPTPKVFTYGLASDPDNQVGVSYILMEALPGTPYISYKATRQQKERVFEQLADILIEISRHPFPQAGSLIEHEETIEVSAFASNRFVALHKYGPFSDSLAYFVQTAEQYLDLIADGQLYHEYPTDAFCFYTMLRDHAHLLVPNEQDGEFFLRHVDDKGDHLLIDETGNVTGIIDWQFARCVPASEAFGPSYFSADLGGLYSGDIGVTSEDSKLAQELRKKGAGDLAAHMERDGFARAFWHGLASGLTRDEARGVIAGVTTGLKSRNLWQGATLEQCEKDSRWGRVKALYHANSESADDSTANIQTP